MKKLYKILIVLLSISCSSQNPETKVLAKGVIYNWKISQMTDHGQTAVFFQLYSNVTKNSNGLYIGIVTLDELQYLVEQLRLFASYADTLERYERSDSFEIYKIDQQIKLSGIGYIYLSKTNAKSLATDIEKSINFMQ
jgi:hypothetical protein